MEQEKLLPPIIAAAIALVVGFGAGAILNRPNRANMQAEIQAVRAKADAKVEAAQKRVADIEKSLEAVQRTASRKIKDTQKKASDEITELRSRLKLLRNQNSVLQAKVNNAVPSIEQKRAPLTISKKMQSQKWYIGGTLHNKTALKWQMASTEDKLATCADFVATMWEKESFIPRIQNSINSVGSMKPYAQELVICLNAATKKDLDPEQNKRIYANQIVSSMATLCMVSMGWLE